MAVIAGQRRSDNIAASQKEIDLHKEILLLEPSAAPLTVFTNNVYGGERRRPAVDPKFSWHEDKSETRTDAINDVTPPVAAGTTWTVDTGTLFSVDDLVFVPRTGEVVLVTGISTNDLTVVRGVGPSVAADMLDNDPLYIIGTADEEGARAQAARSENPVLKDNWTQIFKHTVEMSGSRMSSSNMSSPHDWNHQRRKQGIEHMKDKELAFLFGAPAESEAPASGEGPRRTTGGLNHFATSNRQDAGGSLSETEVETWLRSLFRYGSQKRTVFVSPLIGSVLSNFALGKIQTFAGQETYGVKVMEWQSFHGTINIVKHNLLEVGVLTGYAFAVDFAADVQYRYLAGDGPGGSRDTRYLINRQEPDRDGRKDEWLSECGLQCPQPERHGVLFGVTG